MLSRIRSRVQDRFMGIGIIGNLAGYPNLDPTAALIVGCRVAKPGDMRLLQGWGDGRAR
jgi:hypothetical protein